MNVWTLYVRKENEKLLKQMKELEDGKEEAEEGKEEFYDALVIFSS